MKLNVNNLTKNFSKKNVLKNCSLEAQPGTITAIIGRNGSGKTTLFKAIAGETNLTAGQIFINDKDVLNNIKLKENLVFVPDKYEYFKHTKLAKLAKIYKLIYSNFDENYFFAELNRHNISKNAKFSSLSKGESKLANIILALATKSKIILLDEPLDGIDIININIIVDYLLELQEQGAAIIVASHQLESLEKLCDNLYFIVNKNLEKIELTNYLKYIVAYKEELPQDFFKDFDIKVLNKVGKIYTIATKESLDLEEKLKTSNPIKIEKTAINLSELFMLLAN